MSDKKPVTPTVPHMKINLAPEVYQSHQREKKLHRTATTIGTLVVVVAVGLVGVGVVILGGQKAALAVLNNNIKNSQAKVQTYAELPKAATSQQHSVTLGELYKQRIRFSRFFSVLQSIAPPGIGLTSISITADNTLQIGGTARSYDQVTKFTKALEAVNVTVGQNASPTQQPYFSDIQLTSVESDNSGVTFRISAQMSPEVVNGQ